jgi:ADP-heptose:LPS heptosyltransferase
MPAALSPGLELADFSQPPAISRTASEMAQAFRRRHAGSHRTLFVHTDTKPEKIWPTERFERVLDGFLAEFPDFKALVVDLRGEGIGRGRYPDRVVPVSLPLDACLALVRDSDLFLGIDSCHIHVADLFRVPGVGIFGPSTARRWGYKFGNHRHFQGRGTTETIGPTEVSEALRGLTYSLARLTRAAG